MDLNNKKTTRQSYVEELIDISKENPNILVLDSDLSISTKTELFQKEFPNRFLDSGIAEQDMMGTAAGLATCGKIPFANTYAIFAVGRAYDQIRNSICYPNLNVKICASHAGVSVGADGATHQMLEDIAIMRTLPNIMVFSPSDDLETKFIIREISRIKGPCYVRLTRPKTPIIYDENEKFEIGKAKQIGEGTDATIFATGVCVAESLKAKEKLEAEGINVRVVDVFTIKPIDKETIVKCAKETKKIITVEDHSIIGGLGSAICEVLAEEYPTKVTRLGIKDTFGKSGNAEELMHYYGIDAEEIYNAVKK